MILLSYGTRPEWIKIKPLIYKLNQGKLPYKILFTGQHENIADGWFDILIKIKNKINRLNSIITSICDNINFDNITSVLVQGDTATSFGVALSAFNHNISVIHLEAGLRTYNLNHPYPEEGYRQMISRIADTHLCPTESSKNNLLQESVTGDIFVTGNTVLDNLVKIKSSYGDEIIVTIHRRENHNIIDSWIEEIDKIKGNVSVIRHPNPIVSKAVDKLKNVNVINPLSHDKMIDRIANCKFLITDSGGLQEEGSFFNKRIIICRKTTERPEVLEHHGILCHSPEKLKNIVEMVDKDYIINKSCPFGDGNSSEKIFNILKNKYYKELQ
jgi:UDP-N-acetylglucosamine 2-epimerase (non-hydrolysing)